MTFQYKNALEFIRFFFHVLPIQVEDKHCMSKQYIPSFYLIFKIKFLLYALSYIKRKHNVKRHVHICASTHIKIQWLVHPKSQEIFITTIQC